MADNWIVPEYDQARPAMHRYATIELSIDGQIQVVPISNGDLPIAQRAAAAPRLAAENAQLKEIVFGLWEQHLIRVHLEDGAELPGWAVAKLAILCGKEP